jgi:hypothetical protein
LVTCFFLQRHLLLDGTICVRPESATPGASSGGGGAADKLDSKKNQPPPFGKSALASAPRCACSAAPVSIRRPRSRVPRLGTRLGGSRFKAVLRCVRPHCPAGVVPVPFRQRGKLPRRTDFGAWLTQTTYGRDIQWMIELNGGGRNHTQVSGRNHTPVLPLPQCHKDR